MKLFVALVPLTLAWLVEANEQPDTEWMFDDFEERVNRVSEGELRFLSEPPEKDVHFHNNRMQLNADSIKTGWAKLEQCHKHLDAQDSVQITFSRNTIRKLEIISKKGVDRAWIEQSNVELEGVHSGANVCLRFESRVMHDEDNGFVSVRTGPYMRRFLDGYYPMHVYLEVSYPCKDLKFIRTVHDPQPGFEVGIRECQVYIDTWFEGELYTKLLFQRI